MTEPDVNLHRLRLHGRETCSKAATGCASDEPPASACARAARSMSMLSIRAKARARSIATCVSSSLPGDPDFHL